MTKNVLLLFRLALIGAILLILYLTTTPAEYELTRYVNDKLSHAMAFFVLSLLADFSFPGTRFSMTKTCSLLAYGILIECIQYFLPYRSFSLLDVAGDAAGIVFYIISLPLIMRLPVLRERRLVK